MRYPTSYLLHPYSRPAGEGIARPYKTDGIYLIFSALCHIIYIYYLLNIWESSHTIGGP
jgi:hypothetical protein